MADTGTKPTISQAPKAIGEAIAKPVTKELGQMAKVAIDSVFGTSSSTPAVNPEEEAKKKAEDQKRIANINRFFDALKSNQQVAVQTQQSVDQQKKQEETQEKQQIKQFEFQKKQQKSEVFFKQRSAEIKRKGG